VTEADEPALPTLPRIRTRVLPDAASSASQPNSPPSSGAARSAGSRSTSAAFGLGGGVRNSVFKASPRASSAASAAAAAAPAVSAEQQRALRVSASARLPAHQANSALIRKSLSAMQTLRSGLTAATTPRVLWQKRAAGLRAQESGAA
jgi:hypothetical protein